MYASYLPLGNPFGKIITKTHMQTHAVVVHCTAQRRIKSSQNVTLGETPNKVISLTRLYENNSISYSLYTAESVLFVDISLSWFF